MTTAYEFFKSQLLKRLPDHWLSAVKARHYARMLRRWDDAQEPDLRVVRFLVDNGSTAVDLGANVGVYTSVLSSLVGPRGRVLSVEPVPSTYAILARNVRVLSMSNVELQNVAVSDRPHDVTMVVPSYSSGGGNFYQASIVKVSGSTHGGLQTVNVRALPLDDIAREADNVAFVKCDVEGHEPECLSGARATISRHHPAWLIEVSGDPDIVGSRAHGVFADLAGHGYEAWWFDGSTLKPRRAGDRSDNFFFLAPRHIERLQRVAPSLISSRSGA